MGRRRPDIRRTTAMASTSGTLTERLRGILNISDHRHVMTGDVVVLCRATIGGPTRAGATVHRADEAVGSRPSSMIAAMTASVRRLAVTAITTSAVLAA